MKDWIKDLSRTRFGKGKYSQSYQDELLEIIFENVGTINSIPFCVEFGFNSANLTGGSGVNVARLILERGWNYLLLDGNHENPEINLYRYFLTSSNICDIFKKHNVPSRPEYISIDVDSTDLWLFKALIKEYRAMIYSVEYNSNFPIEKAITFPDDPNEVWHIDRGYGASLKALAMVAKVHDYSLLWVVPYLDAFFIRNDLIDDGSSQICFPLKKWSNCTSLQNHVPLKNKDRVDIFLDYEVYINTDGDIYLSKIGAQQVCRTYLLGNGDYRTKINIVKGFPRKIRKKIFGQHFFES